MDQVKIGKFISKLRKEKGMTQDQLAQRLGVTQRSVSRWETGKNMPDLSLLQPLATELNVSISELLDGEKTSAAEKDVHQTVSQLIDYSAQLKRRQIFRLKDIDFVTGVLLILIIALLAAGGLLNKQTVPMLVIGLIGLIILLRLMFGRCPVCGKPLPFVVGKKKACPFCGVRLK